MAENDTVKETESEVEETDESTTEHPEKDSVDAKLARLERENKRLHRKVGNLETLVPKEQSKESKPDESKLLKKVSLKMAGITAKDEIELLETLQEKTKLDWDTLVEDEYVLSKLEKFRGTKANADATANIKGGAGGSVAKGDPAYWLAKGSYPSREDVPDRETRFKIAKAFLKNQKEGKKFYND